MKQFVRNSDRVLALRAKWAATNNEFVVGMGARWHVQKDHRNLIEAMAIFVENTQVRSKLILFGSNVDSNNTDLCELIEKSSIEGLTITLGHREDFHDIMHAIDLHVMSSFAGEGFPNVVAESMACGTPNVVTDVGDAGLIIDNYGWLVSKSDSTLLAEALVRAFECFSNPKDWRVLCEKCSERIKKEYSVSSMIRNYDAVWNSVQL